MRLEDTDIDNCDVSVPEHLHVDRLRNALYNTPVASDARTSTARIRDIIRTQDTISM